MGLDSRRIGTERWIVMGFLALLAIAIGVASSSFLLLSLAVTGSVAAILIAARYPVAYFLILLATFFFVPVTAGFQISGSLPVVFVWRPLILIGIAVQAFRNREDVSDRSPFAPVVGLIITACLLSLVSSVNPQATEFRLLAFAVEWGGLIYVGWSTLKSEKDCRIAMTTIWLFAFALCVVGLVEAITNVSPVALISTGYDPLARLNGVDVFNVPAVRNGQLRIRGTMTHPIEYGGVMALMLPLSLAAIKSVQPGRRRIAQVLLSALLVLCLALTLSLGPITAACVAVLVLVLFGPNKRRVILVFAGLAVLLAVVVTAGPGSPVYAVVTSRLDITNQDTAQRIAIVVSAIDTVGTSPITGTGLNTWADVRPLSSFAGYLPGGGGPYGGNENFYAEMLVETGYIGIIMILAGLALLVRATWKRARVAARSDVHALSVGLFGAVVGFLALNVTANVMEGWAQLTAIFWIVLLVFVKYHDLVSRRGEVSDPRVPALD
jgi:O-antigen ligase